MKKIIILLLIAAIVGFIGYRVRDAYLARKEADAQAAKGKGPGGARIVSVGLARARRGEVREEILITGALKPKEQVDVTSKVTGRIERVLVNIGDHIKKGDLISEMEDLELRQQVRRAEATLDVSAATLAQRKAELANALADLERSRQLMEQGLIPRVEFESKQTTFRVIQAQVKLTEAQGEAARAELEELKIRLEQMRIFAPIDGQVAERYVDVGAVVSPSTPVARLVNLSTLITRANVPEREVSKLRLGNKAIVQVDAMPGHTYDGKVSRVSPVLDAATRTALVEVEIPNRDNALKAEMFVRVALDLATLRPAVLIPREALVYRGQQPGVYTLSGDQPVFRPVEPGVSQGDEIEILSSIEPGTDLIGQGASMVTEGVRIRVARQPELTGGSLGTTVRSSL